MNQTYAVMKIRELEILTSAMQTLESHFPNLSIRKLELETSPVHALQGQGESASQVFITDRQSEISMIRQAGFLTPTILLGRGEFQFRSFPFSVNQTVDFSNTDALVEAVRQAITASQQFQKLKSSASRLASLAERERKIISLASQGVPNKTIANRLGISIKTVEKNRRAAYTKLAVTNTAEMASLVTFNRFFGSVVPQ